MITTRTAATEDAFRIAEIAREAAYAAWTEVYVKDRLKRDDTIVLVAETTKGPVDGVVIAGFAAFRIVGDDGELLQIATDPAYRRLGAGGSLLAEVIKQAKEKALTSVFLEVRASNTAAITLYEKHGFIKVRVRKDYYPEPVEDAAVMVLTLCHDVKLTNIPVSLNK